MKLKLGVKLIGGFLIVAILVLTSGLIGIINGGKIETATTVITKEKLPIQNAAKNAALTIAITQDTLQKFIAQRLDLDARETEINVSLDEFKMWVTMIINGTDSIAFRESDAGKIYKDKGLSIEVLPATGKVKALAQDALNGLDNFNTYIREIIEAQYSFAKYSLLVDGKMVDLDSYLYRAQVENINWVKSVKTSVDLDTPFTKNLDVKNDLFGKWFEGFSTEDEELSTLIVSLKKYHEKMYGKVNEISKAQTQNEKKKHFRKAMSSIVRVEKISKKCIDYVDGIYTQLRDDKEKNVALVLSSAKNINKTLNSLINYVDSEVNDAVKHAEKTQEQSRFILIIVTAIAVTIAVSLGITLTLGITRPIISIIDKLRIGTDHTNSAATEISNSSMILSQGAAEQAASLEETSSSLEEMSSMTKQNADNAASASKLAEEAQSQAESGNESMSEMHTAMVEITESSDKVSKIIKTIEEISFQTNLLALNAAVEAARAGEHGKGFAVVADEVRNLAQRASVAAKDTAQLIEESVNKTKEGEKIVNKVGESLAEIKAGSSNVVNIVNEIASACKEQAEGILQINVAVSNVDKVTQQNAEGAEKSAASSEELSSQVEMVQNMIFQLQALIDGDSSVSNQILLESDTNQQTAMIEDDFTDI